MLVEPAVTPAPDERFPARRAPALIRKAAVLGAGTMGSRIAAHLANAGLNVVLLDVASEPPARSAVAAQALEGLKKAKPAAFFEPSLAGRIAVGNFEDDMAMLAGCDWVIEAVAENLEIKQALLEKAAPHLKPGAIFTTNTSGLSVTSLAAKLPEEIRRRWFGAHFFNPPRYMRLLEIIATPETDPAAMQAVAEFADVRLGKEVVFARDTPNFIANRIGVFIMLAAARLMQEENLSIEEVDALTGTVIGWPRTGTFRLADLVGLDVLAQVASNLPRTGGMDLALPPFVQAMLERKWLGDKTKQGFYRKEGETRYALDWKTLEYRPASKPTLPALEMAKNVERLDERIRLLLREHFYWRLLTALWNYAADCLPEISGDVSSVDAAMRAGFNWEMGPLQLWDAAGVRATVERMKKEGIAVSPVVQRLFDSGAESWYAAQGREAFHTEAGGYRPIKRPEGVARVADFRASNGVVRRNAGASLIDLGGSAACIELHSKKDAIGEDIVRLVTEALNPDGDAVRNFAAFVISGDSENFSVGANLMQLLLAAQEGEWDEIDRAVRAFQRMTWAIKFCPRPVVVAPFGFCLGGGAELALHAALRQAHAELYMGLVECGVGLIPAGGGSKEMVLRALDAAAAVREGGRSESVEMFDALRRNFETVAMAKVSGSALEARRLGFLNGGDRITMNRNRLLTDARQLALELARAGYAPPAPRTDAPAPGENALATLRMGVRMMREGEYISDHDVNVANRLAHVMCGGKIAPGTPVSEEYFLDLEREAFLSLCGEKKTQERIAFTLKTGKPLRN